MIRYFAPTLTRLGVLMAHPAAFLVLACYVGAWLAFNPKSFDWQSVATVATWLMTLFIQRAEHRDTQAIHAKLDELLRVEGRARNELTQLDDEEPEVIEQHRSEERNGLSQAGEFPLRPFYDPPEPLFAKENRVGRIIMQFQEAPLFSRSFLQHGRAMDIPAMRPRLHLRLRMRPHRCLGGNRSDFSVFRHLAASHQYGHDDRHVPNGLSDPEHA